MPLSNQVVSELTFAQVLVGIVIAWTLVALWQRVIENLAYNTFGLDQKSTYQTFIFALAATVIFFAVLGTLSDFAREIVTGSVSRGPAREPGIDFPSEEPENSQDLFSTINEPDGRVVCARVAHRSRRSHNRRRRACSH